MYRQYVVRAITFSRARCCLRGVCTHLIASSNTLFRFRCVNAEHSKYFTALISLDTCTACSYWIGAIFRCRSCSRTSGSSRRSSLVPTRMMGTPGAWCSISGYHCSAQVLLALVLLSHHSALPGPGFEPICFHKKKRSCTHLRLHVVKRRRAHNGEANQKHVRLRVRQRPQPIVVLLPRRIPQPKTDGLIIHHDARRVVVEDGRDVLAGEGVGGVGYEQAGLAYGAVARDDAFERLRGRCRHAGSGVCLGV